MDFGSDLWNPYPSHQETRQKYHRIEYASDSAKIDISQLYLQEPQNTKIEPGSKRTRLFGHSSATSHYAHHLPQTPPVTGRADRRSEEDPSRPRPCEFDGAYLKPCQKGYHVVSAQAATQPESDRPASVKSEQADRSVVRTTSSYSNLRLNLLRPKIGYR